MKIVVRMRGGLGNQLFILAYAYALANRIPKKTEIVLDPREYETFKLRNFEILELVKDPDLRLWNDETDCSRYYDLSRKAFHIAQRVIRKETGSIRWLSKAGLYYGRRNAAEYRITKRDTAYVYGYFQDERITRQVRKEMLDKMVFPETGEYKVDSCKAAIGVSVRCGQDYKDMGWPVCTAEYYRRGVELIREKKKLPADVPVYVFSDEPDIAKEMNIAPGAAIIRKLSGIQQLGLLRQCSDYVMANSSFSWWGAYLGHKEDSMVVFPRDWYEPGEKTTGTKLIYDNVVVSDIV